jgi:hypothetical protein
MVRGDSRRGGRIRLALLAVLALTAGCRANQPTSITDVLSGDELARAWAPSNYRSWIPAQGVLPTAELRGDHLTVRNIRNCEYLNAEDYVVRYYDKTFDLRQLQTVDFVTVPFRDSPTLAHTMLSFGFSNADYLAVSVEARYEQGETYSPVKGAMRQYELMYVVADERDVIGLRAKHRKDDVFLYRTRASPELGRALLLDMMARANKLAAEPEFYDALSNNCTTNIVAHVNRAQPGRVPLNVGVLLPGYADRLAYDLGLLDTQLPFEKLKKQAQIDRVATRHAEATDFSQRIRQR